ncbi:MAG: ShlB/FhaC/HecB family hemolysin secretion/activation protein [Candidatus Eremiobacterota bacterium]
MTFARRVLLWLCVLLGTGLAAAEVPTFTVRHIDVQGNTVLSASEVQAVVGPYQNRPLTLPDLQTLAGQLRQRYESAGWFLVRVQVPTQNVTEGVVRLKVIEGRIGNLRIQGNEHYSEAMIRSYLRPVTEEKVARLDTLHRCLLLLRDFQNLKVESFVEPGQQEGTSDLVLKVTDSLPLEVGLRYDNFGNQFTGTNRISLTPRAGNLFGNGESLLVAAVFPFPAVSSRPFVLSSLKVPVNRDGTQVGFSYANGAFIVGGDLSVLDIRGNAQIYSLFATHALRRAEHDRSDLFLALTSKSFDNSILGITTSQDEVRSVALGYHAEWSGETTRNFLSTSLTQGLGTFAGGTPNGSPAASRVGAGNSFTRFNVDFAHVSSLGHPFVVLRLAGQGATSPLVVGEQFSLGGPDSVRGYAQSELLGDAGYSVSAELRVPLPEPDSPFQAAAFVDHGREWLLEPQFGERSHRSLTGAGLGFRWAVDERTHLRFDLGFPLDPPVNSVRQSPKIYGQLETRF